MIESESTISASTNQELSIVPFHYNNTEIRVITDDEGNPWWVAKDVCDVLGLTNVTESLLRLDLDEKKTLSNPEVCNKTKKLRVINEPGLYSLIFRSSKNEAKEFKRWVTHEVLPTLRKTGRYDIINQGIDLKQTARQLYGAEDLAKFFGLSGNQAKLSANMAVKITSGIDCMELVGVKNLICEKQESHYTASDIGKPLGLSGQKVNKAMRDAGIVESYRDHKNRLRWRPTTMGEDYTVLKDTGRKAGGTPVQQLFYLESARSILLGVPA